jgi:hypothetical protein
MLTEGIKDIDSIFVEIDDARKRLAGVTGS